MTTEATKDRLDEMLEEMVEGWVWSEAECLLLLDVTSGTGRFFDEVSVRNLHVEVEDAEDAFFAEWGVERQAILSKLGHMDALCRLAILNHIDKLRD